MHRIKRETCFLCGSEYLELGVVLTALINFFVPDGQKDMLGSFPLVEFQN